MASARYAERLNTHQKVSKEAYNQIDGYLRHIQACSDGVHAGITGLVRLCGKHMRIERLRY